MNLPSCSYIPGYKAGLVLSSMTNWTSEAIFIELSDSSWATTGLDTVSCLDACSFISKNAYTISCNVLSKFLMIEVLA